MWFTGCFFSLLAYLELLFWVFFFACPIWLFCHPNYYLKAFKNIYLSEKIHKSKEFLWSYCCNSLVLCVVFLSLCAYLFSMCPLLCLKLVLSLSREYVLQLVCGQLFLMLLLVGEPAMKESKVITYKELKRNWALKTMKSVHCNHSLAFHALFYDFWSFCGSPVPGDFRYCSLVYSSSIVIQQWLL